MCSSQHGTDMQHYLRLPTQVRLSNQSTVPPHAAFQGTGNMKNAPCLLLGRLYAMRQQLLQQRRTDTTTHQLSQRVGRQMRCRHSLGAACTEARAVAQGLLL